MQAIDHVITASISEYRRIIGISSPHEASGVSKLSRHLVEAFSLSHVKPLLIDLSSETTQGDKVDDDWVPILKDPSSFIRHDSAGFDVLESHPDMNERFIFNNIDKFRDILDKELSDYEAIIVDLPAILSGKSESINPASCAAACDAVYLVTMSGQTTRPSLTATKARLDAAKAPLAGVILNDQNYVSTGKSIAQQLQRFSFVPGAKRLAKRVNKTEFLA